jgi:hypothetical protein
MPPRADQVPVVAVASGKGGVGKTTVAVNVAPALTALGLRVGLVDADLTELFPRRPRTRRSGRALPAWPACRSAPRPPWTPTAACR